VKLGEQGRAEADQEAVEEELGWVLQGDGGNRSGQDMSDRRSRPTLSIEWVWGETMIARRNDGEEYCEVVEEHFRSLHRQVAPVAL